MIPVNQGKKTGFALSGGAARGLAHIGVLKVLDQHGICPDIIAGTSIGAVIGALYASGLKALEIEKLALGLDFKRIFSLVEISLPLTGLIHGKRVVALLESILGQTTFDQLKCDYACVTTDIMTGQQVILRDGSLVEALRATISIPGIFTPVLIDDRYLVDGGLVNEVPVSACRALGAEYVIGVNVIPDPSHFLRKAKEEENTRASRPVAAQPEIGNKDDPEPDAHTGLSLRSRLDDIEHAIKTFLQGHQKESSSLPAKEPEQSSFENSRHTLVKAPSLIDIISQTVSIAEYRIAIDNLRDADLAIIPNTNDIGFWQFDKVAQAIISGEQAAIQVLEKHGK
jgi:NTE family protein